MRIYLLEHPWTARPSATIDASSLREWRQAVAEVQPLRSGRAYAAAVEMLNRCGSGKPFPVQVMGQSFREVTDSANILAVRTGLIPERIAAMQWAAIIGMPEYFRQWDAFLGSTGDMVRAKVKPPPRLVDGRGGIPAMAGNLPQPREPTGHPRDGGDGEI